MKSQTLLWQIGMTSLLLGLLGGSLATARNVRVEIQPVTGTPDAVVAVPLLVSGADQVGTLELDLAFDPQQFAFVSAERGQLPDQARVQAEPLQPGRVHLTMISDVPISTDGPWMLARLRLLASPGDRAPVLRVENAKVYRLQGAVPEAVAGSSVPINLAAQQDSWLSPTGWLVLGLGATVVVGLIAVALAALAGRRARASGQSGRED